MHPLPRKTSQAQTHEPYDPDPEVYLKPFFDLASWRKKLTVSELGLPRTLTRPKAL